MVLSVTVACRPVRQGLPDVQRTAHCQEEDARQEANSQPSLQRVLHLRPSHHRPHLHQSQSRWLQPAGWSQPRLRGARLGSDDQERGGGTLGGRCWVSWRCRESSLARGGQLSSQTDRQLAQTQRMNEHPPAAASPFTLRVTCMSPQSITTCSHALHTGV